MARVVLSRAAALDLSEIAAYIAAHNPSAAARLMARLRETSRSLARAPGVGRPRDDLVRGLRSFAVRPYIIFYRQLAGGIEVVRVLHGHRDIAGILANDDS